LDALHTSQARRLNAAAALASTAGVSALTDTLALGSACAFAEIGESGALRGMQFPWAAACDISQPVWHTHVEMNWVWLGTLSAQLVPASRRRTRCVWNGSLRAYRTRTLSFFKRWNTAAHALFGAEAVQCDMRDAKSFMGDWGSDEHHAVFRDVVFGPNLAGNSPESIRHFDQLAAGVITVTVTAEVGERDDEMWRDTAWPCGRPPGIYATSWLQAAVQMQALWGNPAELDTLQAAGTAWLRRYQACSQRDALAVVAAGQSGTHRHAGEGR
jgi:hypothetical protein